MRHRTLLSIALVALLATSAVEAHRSRGGNTDSMGTAAPAAQNVATLEKLKPGTHYTVALIGASGQIQNQGSNFVVTFNSAHDAYDQRPDFVSVFPLQSKNLGADRAVVNFATLLPHLPIVGWLEYMHEDQQQRKWRTKHLVEISAGESPRAGVVSLTVTSATPIRENAIILPAFYGWTTK